MTDDQHKPDRPAPDAERSPADANDNRARLADLLADERIASLNDEDRAELEQLLEKLQAGGGDAVADGISADLDETVGRLLIALDRADDTPGMPDAVRSRLAQRGVAIVAAQGSPAAIPIDSSHRKAPPPANAGPTSKARARSAGGRGALGWVAAAACLLLGAGATAWLWSVNTATERELTRVRAAADDRRAENEQLIADARARADELGERITRLESRNLDLVTRLADATDRAEAAETRIAELETPADPEELRNARRQLLDVNGTIRVAWQPFEVPGLPEAEQPGVDGDVVWNDALQEGYLRFEGLKVNDPAKEQYQVWVIDERGMEQKVSGGVFNATESGELIVPIEPGIDVGNVQVFAVTVEDPGGIWVPDLKRRVVVAPRGEDEDDG